MKEQFYMWRRTWITIALSGFSFLSLSAQSTDGPKGLYKLNEIVHQDGKTTPFLAELNECRCRSGDS